MEWLNIHISALDGPEFKGADPIQRATWLCLLRFAIGQENHGIIEDCREWSDRKWQQIAGVTRKEAMTDCDLWWFEGDSIKVAFYPQRHEDKARKNRILASSGGRAAARKRAAAAGIHIHDPAERVNGAVIENQISEPTVDEIRNAR
jgi:hypothetical protein